MIVYRRIGFFELELLSVRYLERIFSNSLLT